MKDLARVLSVLAVGVAIGALAMRECARTAGGVSAGHEVVSDTMVYHDTVRHILPAPVKEIALGMKRVMLPGAMPDGSAPSGESDSSGATDTARDWKWVSVPVTQRHYADSTYEAWVSGYEPRLDSLFVFPRHEIVRVREPPNKPKRWGIGVFAGYGYTPQGFQPCAGISINYNLWNF